MARKNYPAKRAQRNSGERKNASRQHGRKRGGNEYYSENLTAERQVEQDYVQKIAAPLRALNESQFNGITSIRTKAITFLTGPAGVGKSYIAAAIACEMLLNKQIERIVITRPKITTGNEDFGALPGELEDKFAPYLEPFMETLRERMGAGPLKYALTHGRIVAKPLAFLRGCTFKEDTFVILDEAQNVSCEQMWCYLSRIGTGAKMVIAGDVEQSDLRMKSGLEDAVLRLNGDEDVGVIEFDENDIVRSGLARRIVIAYRRKL